MTEEQKERGSDSAVFYCTGMPHRGVHSENAYRAGYKHAHEKISLKNLTATQLLENPLVLDLVLALQAYKTVDTEKNWCSFIDKEVEGKFVSSKWFHGTVSGDVAIKALAAFEEK